MKPSWAGLFAAILSFAGCVNRPPPPPLVAHPHYTLSAPYEADGHWYYPEENYGLDVTGIASVDGDAPGIEKARSVAPGLTVDAKGRPVAPRLTADGEIRDPTALTAAMQTIQLPAIASVTNLANGRQILVRVNDLGPANPARVIALSPRAALLLQVPAGGAPVRVQVDEVLSHRVLDQLGGGPKLPIAAAPTSTVTAEALPAPGAGAAHGTATVMGARPAEPAGPRVPDRMPEIIRAGAVYGGEYWLHAGKFGRFNYANVRAAKLGGLGGTVVRSRAGRQESYAVRAGPFRSIAEADAALRQAEQAGIPDATIAYE